MSDNGQDEKPKRKQRQSGGFAVGREENGGDSVVWLKNDLPDFAACVKWTEDNGDPADSHTFVQVKATGKRVDVDMVRRAKLV